MVEPQGVIQTKLYQYKKISGVKTEKSTMQNYNYISRL